MDKIMRLTRIELRRLLKKLISTVLDKIANTHDGQYLIGRAYARQVLTQPKYRCIDIFPYTQSRKDDKELYASCTDGICDEMLGGSADYNNEIRNLIDNYGINNEYVQIGIERLREGANRQSKRRFNMPTRKYVD